MSEGPICDNCKNPFDENEHIPMTLPCSHPLCLNCIKKIQPNEKIFCQQCGLDLSNVNLKELKPHQMILDLIHSQSNQSESIYNSQEEGENETNEEGSEENSIKNTIKNNTIEYCNKHKEKEIEFFCQTCTIAVCSKCIFETHNGHHLTLLEDMSTIIKNNVEDFGKILKNLEKVNEDNQTNAENKMDDVEKQKVNQIQIVTKSFEEIIKKIEEKKSSIIDEYNNKYFHEIKRFKKIQSCLQNDQIQIERITHINNELTKNFEKFSDAKILKKIEEFTSFLHKSAMDIKRLYKTEISLKAELAIDPSMKPTPINTSDLLHLLEKIDPKNICYPFDDSLEEETDTSNSKRNGLKIKKEKINDFNYEFDNEINNYIKRVQPQILSTSKSSFSSTENYTSDNSVRYKIPKSQNKKIKLANYNSMKNRNNNHLNKSIQLHHNRNISANVRNSNNNMDLRFQYTENGNFPNLNTINNSINLDNINNNNRYNNNVNLDRNSFIESRNKFKLKNRIPSAGSRNNTVSNSIISLPKINTSNINNGNYLNEISIYFFGEAEYCMRYIINISKWEIIYYSNEKSRLLGSLRYSSICSIPGQKMILTGGCKSKNDEPSNNTFEINSNNINEVNILQPMISKRYGHCLIYLNNNIYSIGGYNHIDRKEESVLSTLKKCEKFNIKKNKWELISNLNHPRAFFGSLIFKKNIFVFGGMYNDQLLSSIEKYDINTNVWSTYPIKLPEKLAKMGIINYNEIIFIIGGINENYKTINTIYQGKFDLKNDNNNWFKGKEMIYPRATSNSAFYWENNIYVFGGSIEGICERYDFGNKKWNIFDSYLTVIKKNNLDNVIKNFSCTFNYFLNPY